MKFARSLTRNMPKYLILFFGLILVFNVFVFFLTPGIKEGHGGHGKGHHDIEKNTKIQKYKNTKIQNR